MSKMEKIKCPFCKKGEIIVFHTPKTKIMRRSRCSAKTAYTPFYKDPKTEVQTQKCPNCGKTKKEIEKRFKEGKKPSREEIMRRMREAGLDPSRIR